MVLSSHKVTLHSLDPRVQQRSRSELSAGRLGWAGGKLSMGRPSSPSVEVVLVPSWRSSVPLSSGEAPQLCWGVEVGSVGDRLRSPRCRWGPLIKTHYLTSLSHGYSRWPWSSRRSPATSSVTLEQGFRLPSRYRSLSQAPGEGPGRLASRARPRRFFLCPQFVKRSSECHKAEVILRTSHVCQSFCEKDWAPGRVASYLLCRTQSVEQLPDLPVLRNLRRVLYSTFILSLPGWF